MMNQQPGVFPDFRLDAADRSDGDPVIREGVEFFLKRLEQRNCPCRTPRLAGRWENRECFHYHLHTETFLQLQGGCLFRFPQQKIERARQLFDKSDVRTLTERRISLHFDRALAALDSLEVDKERTELMREFAESLVNRKK